MKTLPSTSWWSMALCLVFSIPSAKSWNTEVKTHQLTGACTVSNRWRPVKRKRRRGHEVDSAKCGAMAFNVCSAKPMEHRRGSTPCQPRRACTVLRQFLTTFTWYTQSSSGSISLDMMFPGIAAQCLSYAMSFVLLSLCCAFPPQACFRVRMCILIVRVVRFIDRSSQHKPQQTEFPNTTAFEILSWKLCHPGP